MLKLKLTWEMEDGSRFDEWTRPIEMAIAERELYKGRSIIKVLREEETPSENLLLFLAHKIHSRVSDKPIGNFDQWAKKVIEIGMPEFDFPKAASLEA